MADIVDVGIVNGDIDYIIKIGSWMLLMAALAVICAIVASFLSSKTATGFGRDLRKEIFEKVESFSLEEFDKFGTSSLITRTTNDVNQMQQVVMIMQRMMLRAPLMCIGSIVMAISKDSRLSTI